MNKDDAKETVLFAQHANALLNMQLLKLQSSVAPSEFKDIARSFGRAMGEIYISILDPIYKEHKCLLPETMGGTSKVDDQEFVKSREFITTLAKGRT